MRAAVAGVAIWSKGEPNNGSRRNEHYGAINYKNFPAMVDAAMDEPAVQAFVIEWDAVKD